MSIDELLIQALNISLKFTNVTNVECDTISNRVEFTFISGNGNKWFVSYSIQKIGSLYIKTIELLYSYALDVRYSTLDYSQEELKEILKKAVLQ